MKSRRQVVAVLNLASRTQEVIHEHTGKTLEAIAAGRDCLRIAAEEALNLERANLAEANAALRVLLRQNEQDRRGVEEALLANVENLVVPYVEKLVKTRLAPDQAIFLEIIQSHLKAITSPLLRTLSRQLARLTPMETRVASLVRTGKTSKEMAGILGISTNAVLFHRKNVRAKLGLKGEGVNLQSYLSSLSRG